MNATLAMIRRATRATTAASAIVLLAACAAGPDFAPPSAPGADRYPARPGAADAGQGAEPHDPLAPRFPAGSAPALWWRTLGSPTLDEWVREALAHNRDLQAAGAALAAAREQFQARVGATRLPSVDAQFDLARQRALGIPELGPPTVAYSLFAGVVQVNYDLDLFGGIRRQNEAAGADVESQAAELAAARQSLAANLVVTAVRAAALERELGMRTALVELARQRAQLLARRRALGAVPERDRLEAERAAQDAAASLAPLRAQRDQARHALAILLGRAPQDAPEALDLESLTLPTGIPLAVPSELVRTRPDIVAAEARLHAATAMLGVATANQYPKLTLTGSYGSESFQRSSFLHAPTTVWGAGAGVLAPLFSGGSLSAQRRAAGADLDAARQRYESTVLKAFGNVADSLRALEEDERALARSADARALAETLLRDAHRRQDLGAANRLAVIDAEQTLLQERIAEVARKDARLVDTAGLYQAIGSPLD